MMGVNYESKAYKNMIRRSSRKGGRSRVVDWCL